MELKPPIYTNKIVAFLDVLGFENIVRALPGNPELFANLNCALRKIKTVEGEGDRKGSRLEVSVFSDSIVISTDIENLIPLVFEVGWLQARLLYLGIFIRGGIALGPLVHEDGILFGEGMLSAYRLESRAAVYPRILISGELIQKQEYILKGLALLDFDSLAYIDVFRFDVAALEESNLKEDSKESMTFYFKKIRKHIIYGVSCSSEENHLAKYMWFANQFDAAIKRLEVIGVKPITNLTIQGAAV